MCEVRSSNHRLDAICEIYNPKTGHMIKVPFYPLYFYDKGVGTRKPLGVPLDHSIEIEGPLVFTGFGITHIDEGWDDYQDESVEGDIVVVLDSVPKQDYGRFPKDTYASSDYKVSNAAKHGASAMVWTSDPFREPDSEPMPVTYGEEIPGIFIPTFIFNTVITELQRGFDLVSLRGEIEEKPEPKGPFSLDLTMRISYRGNEFKTKESEHFIYFYHSGSKVEEELDTIVEERERAFEKIIGELGIERKEKVRLFLFPSSREKTFYTGSIGSGLDSLPWTIIEVYNREIRLDPWHELTHIISGSLNRDPSSLFSEGLAVYMVAHMSGEQKQIDEQVVRFRNDGELFPLSELIGLEIGSRRSKPAISYPQAGSFVKYLVERYGMERFKRLYSGVCQTQGSEERDGAILQAYGKSLTELEAEWIGGIAGD